MTELLLASAAPVFRLDGAIAGELARDVVRLDVEHSTAGLKQLTLRLLAHGPRPGESEEGLLYLDGAAFDFGTELEVSIGPAGSDRRIFKGKVSGIEACFTEAEEPEVVVFAEDRLMDLRMTRRMKTYERMSDADIASEIAGEHGLGADVAADGPTYDLVHQWNMSDLAFLRERAARVQAEIWLEDETLHFKTRGNRSGSSVTLVQGDHLLAVELRADLAHQRSRVRVSGYDAERREGIDEDAGDEAILAEVSGGVTGPEMLQRAFGERVSHRVREVPLTDSEAQEWARAEMLRRCRQFVTLIGTTRGSPDLEVGSNVTLERVGAPFEGAGYYATWVCQSYDLTDGFRTHLRAERATVNAGAA